MKTWFRWMMSVTALVLSCGCSVIRQSASTSGSGTNLVRTTHLTVKTLGDAKQVVESLRASNGTTHSLGASGVQQESTSEALQSLVQLATLAARASAGLPPVLPTAAGAPIPTVPAPIPSALVNDQGAPAPVVVPAAPKSKADR